MGLFDKKFCAVCGEKAGTVFTRDKLADDSYICGKCIGRCSSELHGALSRMTLADVQEHMLYVEQNAQLYGSLFRETRSIYKPGREKLMSIDDTHGWWIKANSSRPDVFAFDQVIATELRLDTMHVSPEEQREHPIPQIIPPYEGMPVPRPDHKITDMKLRVSLNHAWVSYVEFDLLDAFARPEEIYAAYETAYEIDYALRNPQTIVAAQPVQTAVAEPVVEAIVEPVVEPAPATDMSAAVEAMKKFKELLDLGAISQEEYDAKKKQLLGL